jgi:uncharacterized MAPEG superfamily protein
MGRLCARVRARGWKRRARPAEKEDSTVSPVMIAPALIATVRGDVSKRRTAGNIMANSVLDLLVAPADTVSL